MSGHAAVFDWPHHPLLASFAFSVRHVRLLPRRAPRAVSHFRPRFGHKIVQLFACLLLLRIHLKLIYADSYAY